MSFFTPNTTNKTISREDLQEKLKQRRDQSRKNDVMETINNMSKKQHNKIQKDVKKQMKQMKEDPRITDEMIELHKKCMKELPNIEIPSPLELLNNQTLAKERFEAYINNLIKICMDKNLSKTKFIEMLNSTYTTYNIKIFGLDIVPENLRQYITL